MALKDFAAEVERCSSCSYCKWIPFDKIQSWRFAKNCPSVAFYNFNSFSARGRYQTIRSLLNGEDKSSGAARKIAFTCLTCGSCDVSCKVCRYDLEPLEMVRELKFELVKDGQGLAEHLKTIENLNNTGNILGEDRKKRGDWAEGLNVKQLPTDKAEVLFHAGCKMSYDQDLQANARTAVQILLNAGVDLGILGKFEMCCGGRTNSMGYQDKFAQLAKANIALWEKSGVKTVVTACSDGYHTFNRLYPELGSQVEVLHMIEYIDRLIKEGKIQFRKEIPLTVTYHDPCHLGRQGEPYVPWNGVEKKIKGQIITYEPKKPRYNGAMGIYDQPRDILKSIPGVKLVEMERIREYSWCCGAGGGVCEAYPEFSEWTANERIEEAEATGAEALVTACPWCERNFMDASGIQENGMQVLDIIELVQKAM